MPLNPICGRLLCITLRLIESTIGELAKKAKTLRLASRFSLRCLATCFTVMSNDCLNDPLNYFFNRCLSCRLNILLRNRSEAAQNMAFELRPKL